jgi:hypothetical protein
MVNYRCAYKGNSKSANSLTLFYLGRMPTPTDQLHPNAAHPRWMGPAEILLIVFLAAVPLFSTFPYRVNIFLSWEGAYRISQGQVPYRDFGMPLGYMFWMVPALFFKLFGPQLITLVKAQVFLNILSGLAFRSILKSLQVPAGIRFLSVLLYCISFSFFNFWPWYNHTVIVYQMIGLSFLLHGLLSTPQRWISPVLAGFFIFCSFFTKQDGGGLALMLSLSLLLYHGLREKQWKPLLLFLAGFLVTAFALVAPLTRFNFSYWFNHGQPPHTARISLFDILNELLSGSQWIKFYLLLLLLFALAFYKNFKELLGSKRHTYLFLLTLGILVEAAILQVTSYTPPDNNIFFHAFAFAFLLTLLTQFLPLNFSLARTWVPVALGLLFWWSGVFWKYIQRVMENLAPPVAAVSPTGENVVNRHTYMKLGDTTAVEPAWAFSRLKAFEKIYMPQPTIDGIERLMKLPVVQQGRRLNVLNMSELTPLAVEIPYALPTGPDVPLWYHLGVGMFNREARAYEAQIAAGAYDLVLFEYIPTLNNFYPFRVRNSLLQHYQKVDSFLAPRRGLETKGFIEVFVRR